MAANPRLLAAMLGQAPSTGSEWADTAIPTPRVGHGRVYTPDELMTMQDGAQMTGEPPSGFAEFLRDYWLQQERL